MALFSALALALGLASGARAQNGSDSTDPFLWLEDVHGARATEWVKSENAKTLDVLQKDPHFAQFYGDALAINEDNDKLPAPTFIDGDVYNFLRNADHVRGIWRMTSRVDYLTEKPKWRTVLDLDRLAKDEGKNWVFSGVDCNSPSRTRCLIRLSEGGEDAVTVREFDLKTSAFVPGGFTLPRGKQSFAWIGDDALLVSREWQPGELTASSYPFVVKRLRRGQALSAATEVFRGNKSDVSVQVNERVDGYGHRTAVVRHATSFFEAETYLFAANKIAKLAIPLKSGVGAMVAGRLTVTLNEPWNTDGTTYAAGSLVSLDLAQALAHPAAPKPSLIYAPGPHEALGGVAATRDHLVVSVIEDVKGGAFICTPRSGGGWSRKRLTFPANAAVDVGLGDRDGTTASLYVTGFLTPYSVVFADTETGTLTTAKADTPRFDATNDVVEQHFATSKDGTKVPYFVVRPKSMKFDGNNATLMTAYGGFGVSITPEYDGALGKLWLERGGVYVSANIRGGGEYGPAWHEAGLKTHRQVIYDDFAAVAQDLIAQGITSPRRLGIQGGSNGGLLMGVEFTQHPELWNAVDIEVPLLDMLRYEKIEAGASWVGEYGSVANPDERAFLSSISPYQNLKSGVKYPVPLIWTTTKDDRVGPEHARKFAAKLAALGYPYYFYEVTEGGHGSGANIKEQTFTTALVMTYFTRALMN